MSYRRMKRLALTLVAVFMLPTAIQATFAPRSWFDDFPFGRGWVSSGGTYDEHLVRDVGVLYLALIIVTLWSVWRDELTTAVAIAWTVQGVLHITYHIGHLDELGTVDKIALVGSLAVVPTLAVIAWWAGTQPDRGDRM
ncbi:MAG: hypothetical protein ABIP17_13915 [Ilumatobacteraceae bacterium]